MDCDRLNKLIRNWYMQVQDETLAPARMVEFMQNHILQCDTCLMDANVRAEIKKITAIILPPAKMTKTAKSNKPTVIPPGYPPPPEPLEPEETAASAAEPQPDAEENGVAHDVANKAEEDGAKPDADATDAAADANLE